MTFSNAKVGDRVWSFSNGFGVITGNYSGPIYPICVLFEDQVSETFNYSGRSLEKDKYQTLFWDEVVFEAPSKPLPKLEVDAKVLVWNDDDTDKEPRHFSHFDESGRIVVFADGTTSFSCVIRDKRGQLYDWDNWEAVE